MGGNKKREKHKGKAKATVDPSIGPDEVRICVEFMEPDLAFTKVAKLAAPAKATVEECLRSAQKLLPTRSVLDPKDFVHYVIDGLEGLTVAEWAQLTPGLPPTVNVSTDAGKGLVAKYTALSGEVKELEAQVRDAREQKLSLQAEVKETREQKLSLQAEVKETREQKLSLQAEVKDAKEKKVHAEGLLAAKQDEVMDRMAKLEAETKNGKAELEKQLEQCNAKLEQLQLANADLHKAMAELRELNKKHQERIFELEFLVYHEHK
ncbi:unconventional myosin-XVIIIa-like isoform X2 [Selaginella moellendorffii]|uniref:unconventional myosin-XVIIIa-like isoform X2 n=1 Tax=Selaginella moellendorffii TaxID=88036 RepID=UPI000D1CD048|nr:unconventional myosin-XVIIIa-like isoform X2 [Selaginella moellendorffii]|eukprot:XP_024515834.1 unconventional myosin-XVIIIa-like isoform X2 [Selaginella moellendorffii]